MMYPYQDEDKIREGTPTVPEAVPVWEQPAAHRPKRSRRALKTAALLCACLMVSGAAGLGGGFLALSLWGGAEAPAAQAEAPAAAPAVSAPAQSAAGAMTVSQVVNAVSDSVLAINTEVQTTNFFMQQVTGQAAGSGVIISQDGYLLTNNHVIENATKVSVTLKNGESYDAALVGTDPETDLAVIKIDAGGLQAAVIGSSSALQVGDETIAIGNPLGELGGTVTNGIVSALNREVTIDDRSMNLLQTNAAINPGNSGGGLFNDRGELIGIVVAKSSGVGVEGLGFAIPIDTAKAVADDLIASGYVTGRGELGVSVIDINDSRTAFYYRVPQNGVYLAGVSSGSAAERAGLKIGDGILAVDGAEVSSAAELSSQIARHKAGETIELTILRDGGEQTVSVTLQEKVPESVRKAA